MFPMALIMSYGLWRFCEDITSNKIKITFVSITMFCHAITYLIFWKRIYFEPETIWRLPWNINLRESLAEPIVLYVSIAYVIGFFAVWIYKRKLNNKVHL